MVPIMSHQQPVVRKDPFCFIPGTFHPGRASQSCCSAAAAVSFYAQTGAADVSSPHPAVWNRAVQSNDVAWLQLYFTLLSVSNQMSEILSPENNLNIFISNHLFIQCAAGGGSLFQIRIEPALQMCIDSATARRCQMHTPNPPMLTLSK